jgi:hypothetical protein
MASFQENPIFICGHPKAGTSLITALLDGHPAIVAYPEETLFFRRFLPAVADQSLADAITLAEELLIHIFEWNQESPPPHQKDYPDRDYSDISFEEVRKAFHDELKALGSRPHHFLTAAVMAFGNISGLKKATSRYWVEKSPYNEQFTDRIFDWWPEAKCIHIVRDPRDNFVSYRRKQPQWTTRVFAWNWVRSTRAGLDNQKKWGASRYHLLRFEDLLNNPENAMQAVAGFLDLPWHDALLQPTRVGESWRGNSMFAEKYEAISTAPIGRWKTKLESYDLALLQMIAGKVMRRMAYSIATVDYSGISFKKRLRLLREKMTVWLKGA